MVDARAPRLLDLQRGQRTVRDDHVGPDRLEVAEEGPRHRQRCAVELALEAPGAVHPRAPLQHVDRRAGHQEQHVACLEADLLHAEMAWSVIRDPAERRGEPPIELPLGMELHEILAEIMDPRDDPLRRGARDQPWVLLLQHAAAGRPRHDDVVAGGHGAPEALEVAPRAASRSGDVAPIERGHPAADLLGAAHLDSVAPEHLHRGDADVGRVELDGRRVEERDPSRHPESRGRPLAPEPAAEAVPVAWQASPPVDAEGLLHPPTEHAIAVRPVRETGKRRADPPEELRVPENPVPQRDALTVGADHPRALHELWEIDAPAVGRRVRAVRVAELAPEAQVDRPAVLLGRERPDVSVVTVDRVEEMGERRAEVVAAPAPGADVVDARGLGGEGRRIAKPRRPDVRRVCHLIRGSASGVPS